MSTVLFAVVTVLDQRFHVLDPNVFQNVRYNGNEPTMWVITEAMSEIKQQQFDVPHCDVVLGEK